jgi:hypothetical protein
LGPSFPALPPCFVVDFLWNISIPLSFSFVYILYSLCSYHEDYI